MECREREQVKGYIHVQMTMHNEYLSHVSGLLKIKYYPIFKKFWVNPDSIIHILYMRVYSLYSDFYVYVYTYIELCQYREALDLEILTSCLFPVLLAPSPRHGWLGS